MACPAMTIPSSSTATSLALRSTFLPASAASLLPRVVPPSRLPDGSSATSRSSRRRCTLVPVRAATGVRSSGSGNPATKKRGEVAAAAAAAAAAGASSAPSAATTTAAESTDDATGEQRPLLGCPVCFQPLSIAGSRSARTFNMWVALLHAKSCRYIGSFTWIPLLSPEFSHYLNPPASHSPPSPPRNTASRMRLQCATCARVYATSSAGFADLTLTAGVTEYVEPSLPFRSEAFKSPVFSFVYERGYRQNFTRSGFPGPDEEFRMAQQWLDSHEGGRVVDLSCGSGLFTRRFAAAGGWATIIAADLSGAMLEQTAAYIKEDKSLTEAQERIMLVQADVARLPFCSGSIDAIHAGAAMHCWPSPSLAMAEINRVLRPGGKFVASTILWPSAPFGNELFQSLRKSMRADTTMKFWEGEELRELLQLSGFVEYRQETNGHGMDAVWHSVEHGMEAGCVGRSPVQELRDFVEIMEGPA
ncbi:unnamed protein product [Closterium sp. Yama58-4]|nr:unnamed protein product [Closterium sp. Yama58-4]